MSEAKPSPVCQFSLQNVSLVTSLKIPTGEGG